MGSPIFFHDFQRWFSRHGVEIVKAGRGSHYKMIRIVGGVRHIYFVPTVSGRKVKDAYLSKARKALKLLPADGMSDEEFFK